MKNYKKFVRGAGMLALLSVAAKAIGMFYRLPLTNILGAEGMGLYQMIFPLYSLILAISSGGLPAAISKYVSELNALNDIKAARRALGVSIIVLCILGSIAAIGVFVLRGMIATLQGNVKAGIAYAAIAPAIVLSGIIACFRGYFQGFQNMLPGGISQIIEQAVKVVLGLIFASVFIKRGVEYGVFGALIGVTVSEAAALFYLFVRYALNRPRAAKFSRQLAFEAAADVTVREEKKIKFTEILKQIYSVALPVTLGSLVLPLSQFADSFLIINLLTKSGADTEGATAMFGLFNGPVGSLLNMPTVVSVALAASLLPKVAFCKSKGESIDETIDKSVSMFFAFMLPCAAAFALVPQPILRLLYSRGLTSDEIQIGATLLRIESVNLLLIGGIQLSTAMMQGVGKAKIPVFNLLLGAITKVAVTFALMPLMGIYGAALGNVIFYGITFSLDMLCAKKYSYAKINLKKLAKIFLCATCFAAALSSYTILALFMNDIIAFVCAAGVAGFAYLLLLIKTKCIFLREMLS